MNTLTLPQFIFEFEEQVNILATLSDFNISLLRGYNKVFDTLYAQEIFGLPTLNYYVLDDIYLLLELLTLVELERQRTIDEDLLTYKEYMEKYHIDCLYKNLLCRGVNVKALMIAFDPGYSNINNIPSVEPGIGELIISDVTPNINDLTIQ
jgi:hypothetical protein